MSGENGRHSWLRALGREELPASIDLPDGRYELLRTYKHDFFAATGLYGGPGGRVVLKLGRRVSLLGLPMAWLGEHLADRECAIYDALAGVQGVPRCIGRWGRTGFVHEFVEGHPLQRREPVADDFFPRLRQLLEQVHARNLAYVDLEKRENILVDADGRPCLIDFQISWYWPSVGGRPRGGWRRLLPAVAGRFVLGRLQRGDRYHLLKHWRRHRPDLLTPAELAESYRVGFWIRVHRLISWPIQSVRRLALRLLTGRWRSKKQDGPEFV